MHFFDFPAPIIIDSEPKAIELAKAIKESNGMWAVDTETTGRSIKEKISPLADDILCWSLSDGKERYFVYDKKSETILDKSKQHFLHIFDKPLFNNPNVIIVFHNMKYDRHCLLNHGITLADPVCDTMVMHWLVDENQLHGLKELSRMFFDIQMTAYHKVFGKRKPPELLTNNFEKKEDWETHYDMVIEYASLDAFITAKLFLELKARLKDIPWTDEKNMWQYYVEIEREFSTVLFNMERRGIKIDTDRLEIAKKDINESVDVIQAYFNGIAGKVINLNSVYDLRSLLYDDLKLPVLDYTAGGESGAVSPATNVATLNKLRPYNKQVIDNLLEYRYLVKIRSTYIEGILRSVESAEDGRLHGTLNQHITRTGRLSGTNPNNTNMPRVSDDRYEIRKSFIARSGYKLITVDYSQAEIRLIAHLSEDQALIEDLKGDVYTKVCSRMLKIPEEEVTKEQRKLYKIVVLGTNYGMGPSKLAASIEDGVGWENTHLGIPKNEKEKIKLAKQLLSDYFKVYRDLKEWIDGTPFLARTHKPIPFVRTLLGRYRRLPELNSPDIATSMMAEREAVNTGPQGGVADLMRGAMIQLEEDSILQELDCTLLMQIHDEVVMEAPIMNIEKALDRIQEILAHPLDKYGITLCLPLLSEAAVNTFWEKA